MIRALLRTLTNIFLLIGPEMLERSGSVSNDKNLKFYLKKRN